MIGALLSLLHIWPFLLAGIAVVAAIVLIPGASALAIKNWKWLAIAALVAALAFVWNLAGRRSADLATARADAATAAASAAAWKGAYDQQALLAKATNEAHAAETTALINTQRAVGSAKEGAAHAPGADDRFAYSDAAYGFLRGPRSAPAGSAAAPAPGVDVK